MQVPKTCVLPLDDAPAISNGGHSSICDPQLSAGVYPNIFWKYSARERVFAGNTRQASRDTSRETANADSSSEKNPKTEDPLPDSKAAVAPRSSRKALGFQDGRVGREDRSLEIIKDLSQAMPAFLHLTNKTLNSMVLR